MPECKGTRLYEDLSDETAASLRHSVVEIRTRWSGGRTGVDRGQEVDERTDTGRGGLGDRSKVRSVRREGGGGVQAKLAANWPVCMIPLRSSMTFRSCGLVAVLIASSRSMTPSDNNVTNDWSKVNIP